MKPAWLFGVLCGASGAWLASRLVKRPQSPTLSFERVLPRLHELLQCAPIDDSSAYSPDLGASLLATRGKLEAFIKVEQSLAALDSGAWLHLKSRAVPRLSRRDPARGWRELFDTLNEARAYRHLRRLGCTEIRFIPETRERTPDLEGTLAAQTGLCEVKTINVSVDEADRRRRIFSGEACAWETHAANRVEFLQKVITSIGDAIDQFDAYCQADRARRIVFVVVNFDDWLGEYQQEYFHQIDVHLESTSLADVEIVFCPVANYFDRQFQMRTAQVVEL
jgi:hypothetical protein